MAYRVLVTPAARKELERLRDDNLLRRIRTAIASLGENPRPAGALKLSGSDLWRIEWASFE